MAKEVPVFPLPNTVLLPGVTLPLHIFEPRYKKMMDAVEVRGGRLAVAWTRPEGDAAAPAAVCCVGKVQVLRVHEDGRRDILVTGQSRVRVERYVQEAPYRVARVEALPLAAMPHEAYRDRLRELKEKFARWVFLGFHDATRVIQHVHALTDLDRLCNFVVFYFMHEASVKQAYLEMDGLEEKSERVLAFVRENALSLEHHIGLLRSPAPGAAPAMPGLEGRFSSDDDRTVH